MRSMQAVVFDSFGGPEVLRAESRALPQLREGEVLVRVEAVSVNGADLLSRSGGLGLLGGRRFPKQIGLDFVGSIAAAHVETDL